MTEVHLHPLTCPNGHAMDDGLFNCPCCGAYRPSASDPQALIRDGRVIGTRPSRLSLETQRALGLERTPDVVDRLVDRWERRA